MRKYPMLVVCQKRFFEFFLFTSLLFHGGAAFAQVSWDGGASTSNWADANNWNPNGVPAATDDVTISGATSIVDIPNGFTASVKSLAISSEASLTVDNSGVLEIDGSTSTYALSLNGGYINVFGTLQITNCQSGIGLLGNASSVTNTGVVSVNNHTGYGLTIASGCVDCNVVTSSDMSFDNGSTLPAVFFGASGNSGNIIINSGTMNIGATAHAGIGIGLGNVSGYFLNTGTVNIISTGGAGLSSGFIPGRFSNSSTGIVNFGAGIGGNWVGGFNLNLQNDGQININKAGTAVSVVVSGTGVFGGSEAFATNNKVSPGNVGNAGCLLFNTGYSNSGTTNIKIGGTTQCAEYDVLFGSTTLDVGGTLNVTLENGFVPTPGQSFTIINAATRTGLFTTTNYPSVPGIAWTTSYTSNSVIANAQAALPVELTGFTAKPIDEHSILLNWQTASEVNNAGFQIESSTDGSQWQIVGFVPGQVSSSKSKYYHFRDTPAKGVAAIYYRLRQMDVDSRSVLSEVVAVRLSTDLSSSELTVSPNPTNGFFHVKGEFSPDALLVLYDCLGRVVMQGNTANDMQYDASGLENGIYILAIYGQQNVTTCRLKKQD